MSGEGTRLTAFFDRRIDVVHLFLESGPLLRRESNAFLPRTQFATVSVQIEVPYVDQHTA